MQPENNLVQLLPVGVSILLCTYNSVSRINETLTCLACQVLAPGIPYEVILVDNACTDGTTAKAEACWSQLATTIPLRTFTEPKAGKNLAIKLACSQARYRYTCIVDDDNRLDPDYLQVGYDMLEAHAEIGILGGQNRGTFEVTPPSWFPDFQGYYAVGVPRGSVGGKAAPLPEGNIGRNILWGAGMFVRAEVWQRLAHVGFKSLFTGRQGSNKLVAGEDDELCYAAQILGYEVWYTSRLRLEHYMTANRLTVAYRNKLFYSSVWTMSRSSAYRSALAKLEQEKPSPALNLVKDFLYMSWGTLQQIFSVYTINAFFNGDYMYIMSCKQRALTMLEYVVNCRRTIGYYKTVESFKEKAKAVTRHQSLSIPVLQR